jgi:hypothetical protein
MEVNGQLGNCIQKEWKRLEEEVGSINFVFDWSMMM